MVVLAAASLSFLNSSGLIQFGKLNAMSITANVTKARRKRFFMLFVHQCLHLVKTQHIKNGGIPSPLSGTDSHLMNEMFHNCLDNSRLSAVASLVYYVHYEQVSTV